ncbi:GTP-binding protein YchF [Vavraia culicis subsp. floridensis]|uniref:Obg-like ATPase homolog n=1 Tax=Vavraia culicis (isolate floridensis) TaxID=948595 RepID=L2GVD1_VAVCU|nr:GTP-binding protein YchF [Vavraia culicis subsp. floridensis]ELA47626.1 GTP-binding protein YchF [Vavraia culicis subsp. floridensis]
MTVMFSRPGKSHNLSMGIVGLPNVGKSTLFNALTKRSVPAANYPFCTITPEEGRIEIPDERFDYLVNLYKPKSVVPAYLSIIDIAGLIKGASQGLGLGNEFLENIRRTDGIFQVVRCFEDENIVHVDEDIDPLRDVKTIKDELRLKDLQIITKRIEKQKRETVVDAKKKKFETQTLDKLREILEIKWTNEAEWTPDEVEYLNTLNLLTTKEVVYLANISEDEYDNKLVNKHLRALIKAERNVFPFSATNLSDAFVRKLLWKGYEALKLINFFTAGAPEVKSWTVREGTKAPQAAAVIHSDFEKNFIMAEVMEYNDIKLHGNEQGVKKAGRYLHKGRDYVVQDGNIILFKINRIAKK